MFSHYAIRKISPICKISTFSEDLSFLNPRSHLTSISVLFTPLKKFIEVHFNSSKIFVLCFYDAYDVNLWDKKVWQKYGLLMQNKCLYKIPSLLWKKNRHSWRPNNLSKKNLNQWESMGFRNFIAPVLINFVTKF